VKERLADLLRTGDKTYDEVLSIVKAGKMTYRPRPYAADTVDLDEIEDNSTYDAFAGLTFGKTPTITPEQMEELRAAEMAAYGPKEEAPEAEEEVDFDTAFYGGWEPFGDHEYRVLQYGSKPTALLRVRRITIQSWQPTSRTWVDAGYYFDSVYGPDQRDTTSLTRDEAKALAQRLTDEGRGDITPEGQARLRKLAAVPLVRNGPYLD
jgi:hypothetical protein